MAQERCEEQMETSDIVIHKGEKDEKYQLYVEDYVMSYLKKQGSVQRNRKIFFFGKKELREKKYYIYGAGLQRQISHFTQYEKLHEITCRYVMDMPVFSIQEKNKTHELTGYYIFYQSNEAMQNYMIELRKEQEQGEKQPQTEFRQTGRGEIEDRQTERAANTEQRIYDIKKQRLQEKEQEKKDTTKQDKRASYIQKPKGGLIAIQLTAVFIILAAIIINTTNSYGKLEELNQAAVEVFFAIENEDVAETNTSIEESVVIDDSAEPEQAEEVVQMEGTTLYLTELDEHVVEENAAIVDKETEDKDTETTIEATRTESAEEVKTEGAETVDEAVTEVAAIEDTGSTEAVARDFAQYYQIEKGDTLYTISQKVYGNTSKVEEICELNQINDPDNIKYGQKILLP